MRRLMPVLLLVACNDASVVVNEERTAVCGDGEIQSTEDCDDALSTTTACEYGEVACEICQECEWVTGETSFCGDGRVDADAGETCDDNNSETDGCLYGEAACTVCTQDCVEGAGLPSLCGDGARDESEEECDDGNIITERCVYGETSCTVCAENCTELGGITSYCGDLLVDISGGENCDDGDAITNNCDYGDTDCLVCMANCEQGLGFTSYCGDSEIDAAHENCDDGNAETEPCFYGETSCTVCAADCSNVSGATSYCGDEIIDGDNAEVCDEGVNNSDTEVDACRIDCQPAGCGDGVVDTNELCDDGSLLLWLGCNDSCDLRTEIEPNDESVSASALELGEEILGNIDLPASSVADVDTYSISLVAGTVIDVEVLAESGSLVDLSVSLARESEGELIQLASGTDPETADARFIYLVATTATYHLVVSDSRNFDDPSPVGGDSPTFAYRVLVTAEPAVITDITVPGLHNDALSAIGEADLLAFSLDAGTVFDLRFFGFGSAWSEDNLVVELVDRNSFEPFPLVELLTGLFRSATTTAIDVLVVVRHGQGEGGTDYGYRLQTTTQAADSVSDTEGNDSEGSAVDLSANLNTSSDSPQLVSNGRVGDNGDERDCFALNLESATMLSAISMPRGDEAADTSVALYQSPAAVTLDTPMVASADNPRLGTYGALTQYIVPSTGSMGENYVLCVEAENGAAGDYALLLMLERCDLSLGLVGSSGDLIINEILIDPPAGLLGDANGDGIRDAQDDEFVEIVNTFDGLLNVSGARLLDSSGTGGVIIECEAYLQRGEALLVFGGGDPVAHPSAQVFWPSSGGLSLNNDADTLTLVDTFGDWTDDYTWSSASPAGESRQREPELSGAFVGHSTVAPGGAIMSPGNRIDGLSHELLPACGLSFEDASGCATDIATCDADFVGNFTGGCETVVPPSCALDGVNAYRVQNGTLEMEFEGDVAALDLYFVHEGDSSFGSLSFFNQDGTEIGIGLTSNVDCSQSSGSLLSLTFPQVVRSIHVEATGTVWLDALNINP